MQGKNHIPTNTARYYAHRVRDSLTTRVSKLICGTFLCFLAVIVIITFVLWISLRSHRPTIHIHGFSISGLGSESKFKNTQINFKLTTRNSNQNIGIYYEDMSGSVYYRDENIGSTRLLFPFYQEPKSTTVVNGELKGATLKMRSDRWTEVMHDERTKGSVTFRLELTATIRFRLSMWQSKHQRMHANCDVAVGPDGSILKVFRDKRCPVYFSFLHK